MDAQTHEARSVQETGPKQKRQSVQQGAKGGMSNQALLQMLHADQPKPLPPDRRARFEPGFGADFSKMRISYASIPKEMGFLAATRGRDILLDRHAGADTLGHELAHVVQTANHRVPSSGFPLVHDTAMEREADLLGSRVAGGGSAVSEAAASPMPITP